MKSVRVVQQLAPDTVRWQEDKYALQQHFCYRNDRGNWTADLWATIQYPAMHCVWCTNLLVRIVSADSFHFLISFSSTNLKHSGETDLRTQNSYVINQLQTSQSEPLALFSQSQPVSPNFTSWLGEVLVSFNVCFEYEYYAFFLFFCIITQGIYCSKTSATRQLLTSMRCLFYCLFTLIYFMF